MGLEESWKIVDKLYRWMKSRRREKYTFEEFFYKFKKAQRIRKLNPELKKQILNQIEGMVLPDGRHVIVDKNKRRIFIGKLID